MEQMETERRAHIFQMGDASGLDQLTQQRSRALFNGQTEYGRTDHVIVYTDSTAQGDATAQAVLQTVEDDYQATQGWFGGIALPPGQEGDDQTVPRTATPVQVLMDAQAGGAYHFGCNATDLYLEPAPELASGFFVAELVEVFEAAINNGWDCGFTNGEGLSRVLAGERNPNLGSLFVQTEQSWWADGRQDFVTDNSADDTNQDANGCATLFLYYLHSQLGYDWTTIVTTGGISLADTYQRLTGQDPAAGFNDFIAQLSTLDMGGFLNVPASGNPFPLGAAAPPAQPQPGGSAGQAAPVGVAAGSAALDSPTPYGMIGDAALGAAAIGAAALQDSGAEVVEREVAVYAAPAPDTSDTSDTSAGDRAVDAMPRAHAVYETEVEEVETIYPTAPAVAAASDAGAPTTRDTSRDPWRDPSQDLWAQSAPSAPTSARLESDALAGAGPRELRGLDLAEPVTEPTPARLLREHRDAAAVASAVASAAPASAMSPDSLPEAPAPYLPVAPTRNDGVETMIGVLVILIVLVLLALITVLFYGGVVRL